MDFKTECPYCHSTVREEIIPYVQELDMYGYKFFCNCVKNDDVMRYNEHAAYQAYLEEREQNNLTNFDKFLNNGHTFEEFDKWMDDWCYRQDIECKDCIFTKIALKVNPSETYTTCYELMEWLQEKVKK